MNTSLPTSATPAATPQRRRRWPWVLLATVVFLIVVPFGMYWYVQWSTAHDTETAMAELNQLDPDWKLDDIEAKREVLKPEENSALQVMKVYTLARGARNKTWTPDFSDQFDNLAAPFELNALQIEMLRDEYADVQEAVQEARKLKDMPKGRFAITYSADFISTLLPNQQNARRVMELLQHDVWLRAQAGDLDGAIESCRAGLNTARSLGDEPLLIPVLIRVAGDHIAINALERTLSQGRRPSDAALKSIQDLLEQEIIDAQKHWAQSLRGERAGQQRVVQAINEGKLRASALVWNGFGGGGTPSVAEWFVDRVPAVFTRDGPVLLRHMNQVVDATQLPLHEQRERLKELEKNIPKGSMLVKLLAPALEKVGMAHVRNQALLRSAQVAVAAERYRLQHERWPASGAELVKSGLLDYVPADPFDGAELRLRRWDEGLVVYAVGFDKTDDRGTLDMRRIYEPGVDIGFKLWDPDRRRQAPRPPVLKDNGAPRGP